MIDVKSTLNLLEFKEENDWSIGICDKATISDLSKETIVKARELYSIKNPKLLDKLPDVLNEQQKKNKLHNNLQPLIK